MTIRNKMTNGIPCNKDNKSNGFSSTTYESATSSSNNFLISEEKQIAKKKLLELANDEKFNYHNNNNNNIDTGEEFFSDTYTIKKSHVNLDKEEPIVVFSQTAKDQFAAALLRLQTNLDSTTKRLNSIETKVDNLTRQQKEGNKNSKLESNKKSGIFNKNNLANLVYFGWPIFVYIAMRTIEKRRLQVNN